MILSQNYKKQTTKETPGNHNANTARLLKRMVYEETFFVVLVGIWAWIPGSVKSLSVKQHKTLSSTLLNSEIGYIVQSLWFAM